VAHSADSNRACERADGGKAVVSDPTREEIGDLLRRLVDTAVEMKDRAEQAEAQLAKARVNALREAAYVARNACLVPPDGGNPTEAEAAVCDEAYIRILALIDTPTPAPSPDDLVRAALEWASSICDVATMDHVGDVIRGKGDEIRTAATDPATVAAIIERSGE
jgi:hypothetical protein